MKRSTNSDSSPASSVGLSYTAIKGLHLSPQSPFKTRELGIPTTSLILEGAALRRAFKGTDQPKRLTRKSCLVIGVGNPFMRDDGVGIEAVKALRKLGLGPRVVILERQFADISILTCAKGVSKLVIVDAVKSGNPPGVIVRFGTDEPQASPLLIPVSHESGLHDILALARKSRVALPPITVVGVEPADCSPGEGLSKPVADALPLLVKKVTAEVKNWSRGSRSLPSAKLKQTRPS